MSEEDYFAGVDWLERIDPGNAMLRRLSSGFTKMNTIYLRRLLKERGERPREAPKRDLPDLDRVDPDFVDLNRKIGALFGRRRQLSNGFHNCRGSKAEKKIKRAAISDDIRNIQQQIAKALKQKRHYEQYGTIPEEVEDQDVIEQMAGISLQRAYNANSKRRNYANRQVAYWSASNDPKAETMLEKWEKKLKTEQDEFNRLSKALREAAV